jgi:hypothetical protein
MRVSRLFERISLIGLGRVKEGALSECRQQLSRTFVPSERRIALNQVACCMHVPAVRGFADTVLFEYN